jgi:hypothetical protein
MTKPTPDEFDTLAALSKLPVVTELAPDFYVRHEDALNDAISFVQLVGMQDRAVRTILSFTSASVGTTADELRGRFESARASACENDRVGRLLIRVLRGLQDVFHDPEVPNFLEESRWGIVGAFARSVH